MSRKISPVSRATEKGFVSNQRSLKTQLSRTKKVTGWHCWHSRATGLQWSVESSVRVKAEKGTACECGKNSWGTRQRKKIWPTIEKEVNYSVVQHHVLVNWEQSRGKMGQDPGRP